MNNQPDDGAAEGGLKRGRPVGQRAGQRPGGPRLRKTTLNQMRYAALVATGTDRKRAKEMAGYARSMSPSEVEAKLPHEVFQAEMLRQGLTPAAIVAKLREGLGATVTEAFLHQKTGEVVTAEFVDFATRQKYLDVALRLSGAYTQAKDVRADAGQSVDVLSIVQNHVHLSEAEFLDVVQKARAGQAVPLLPAPPPENG